MATIQRRADAACPKQINSGRADPVLPRDAIAEPEPEPTVDQQDYFFWGINELYVAS
jgi:hypothetical protein